MSSENSGSAVLVANSRVVRGRVGGRASEFVLERLGREVWSLPTILAPHHPGHGPGTWITPPPDEFAGLVDDLAASPKLAEIGAVLTGFIRGRGQAEALARLVRAVKAANPAALHLCDPVLGDHGALYVPEETAEAIRDLLLPLADFATPNLFETFWLAGRPLPEAPSLAGMLAAARTLGPARVALTSAPGMMRGAIATLLVAPDRAHLAETQRLEGAPSGTGDLFAALLLARLMRGEEEAKALEAAVSATFEIIAHTLRRGADELALVAEQGRLERPFAHVAIRTLRG